MTYMYPCNRKGCIGKGDGGEIFSHWKSSCCHKCPNPSCRDHGECNCFNQLQEQRRKYMGEMMDSPEWIEKMIEKLDKEYEDVKVDNNSNSQSNEVIEENKEE